MRFWTEILHDFQRSWREAKQRSDSIKLGKTMNVAESEDTPGEVLDALSTHPNQLIVKIVAWNASTSVETLERLCNSDDPEIRAAVAANEGHGDRLRLWLLDDPDWRVRHEAVSYLEHRPSVLEKAAPDLTPRVRMLVAILPNTPADTLWELASDGDVLVRRMVAWNRFAPAALRTHLSEDPDERVRDKALSDPLANGATPPELLIRIPSVFRPDPPAGWV